ncbi:trichohyalin [Pleuronectes platessa]|uniref:trichohyalin n=1 Tax=Pleuronectes platessa TaxID=8262 RepID=UPI00232A2A1C|nr:trichohyalin [Pleuronectes platessa]XP_053285278.1 trichohyalin [Pleuronectes platessa]
MQHSQRLDQRLHMLRDEVRAMTREKERGERVWRERLQRCQRQLKAKEEEMSRQCQYFENFKTQLQHKLSLGRDREQSLQNRIYTLEKRLLDMTVSAATGMATIRAARITAGTVTLREEQERLTSMRGEGEGEEERKEERMKQLQTSVIPEREGGLEGDEGQTEKEMEGGGNNDTKPSSDESRLQGFILSLQEDLRVLLERGEDGMTERRGLVEQLTEAQENGLFLGNRVEEMKAEVHGLKLSESSLMEEVEELREENDRLQLVLREAANQTASQSPTVACTSKEKNSVGSSAEVQPSLTGGVDQSQVSAVPPDHHQVPAEITLNKPNCGSKHNLSFQSLSLTSETVDEFNLETWCCRGILDLEQSPSEESDALREACKSLGLGEDLADLREQRGSLEAALQHTQEELEMVTQENTQLKIQLRQQAEERAAEQGSSREKIGHAQSSPPQDNNILTLAQDELAKDELAQALNQENRALAERIEELLAHIELREVEIKKEQSQLRERAPRLEEVRVRLEQENREQGCLITELTRKTEDDLNTIMELQQKLEESGKQSNAEECVDNMVERIETQSTSSTQTDDLISVSATGSQHNNHHNLLQNSQPNTLHTSALNDQVCPLTKTVQSLKTEQDELIGNLNSLREQQGEVAQSVQTKTEEKQQLTRAVWGLKEEKDRISQCLAGLRQEREQLTRTLCGLKDNRDHFISSMSGLKEEKEQLTKTLSSLEREKENHLSIEKEEQEQIKQSLQSLQTERDQLSRVLLSLKQEREEITTSLKCLKEQRDQEQSSHTSKDDCDNLMKTLSSLRDEKERVEHSITRLRHEEKQIALVTQSLKEEKQSLLSESHSQTQTQQRNQRQQPVNPNTTDPTEDTETVLGTGQAIQRCQTNNNRGKSLQEQRDLLRETEVLGSQLKTSREELDRSNIQAKKLQSELCQSEARREEAERTAAEKGMRLTDVANQMEETRRENKSLSTQVKELQGKVTGLLREKSDALLLKTQIEEQNNILTAQLKAKTVALDELNSEYITLKRGQGFKHDDALMSVRTRYNDIRAKYDALLKKRSQTDLDLAPLKAKVSCLVVKCQERNNLLAKMMKAMHRHGCADSTLNQQVELLLSDAALRDYTAAFTPGGIATTGDYSAGFNFTPRFISTFIHSDCSTGSVRGQSCPTVLSPAHELTPEAGRTCRDFKRDGHVSISTASSTNIQDCRSEVTRNTSSPVQEKPSVEATTALTESSITNTAKLGLPGLQSTQLSLSPSGLIQANDGTETFGFPRSDVRGKSSPDLTSSTSSSQSPTPPPSTGTPRRLSSPEKILNLHEQLQRTLMSSYQAPVSRGRGQEPRKSLSFSVPADLNLTCQTNRLSFNKPHINSLPVTAASNQTTHAGITIKPATTLFNAVASRSAHVSFSPSSFTHHHFKASALSGSSNESKSPPHSGTDMTVSTDMTEKLPAVPNSFERRHTTPLTLGTNSFDSNVSICPDTNLKRTASYTTAPGKSTAPECNTSNGAAHAARDRPVFTGSWTHCGHRSPERPNRSARKSTAAGDQTQTARPRPDAPAEVRSVEVIQTVGQSSLMIGWERPPLDELGCSNGTFVYGYRLLIDGDFHKSVMSSACTKCIAENVDLSVPIHISVQTLGSNGLSSNSVHTVFRKDHR